MTVSRKRLVADLSGLVQIPSWQECDTVAEHAAALLRGAGVADVRRDAAGNVLATLGRGGPGLLLNAHLDTVPPADYRGDPYSGRVVGGRLLGRGSSDDKASVAALVEIARHLAGAELTQRVTIALTVWEEATGRGPNGSYQVARDVEASRGIILESTMSPSGGTMGVHCGCKGNMTLEMLVRGKAWHASQPQKGRNAVYRAAEVVRQFRAAFDPETMPERSYRIGRRDVTLRELATVTEIEATQGINIIPPECRVRANCRTLPDGDDAEIRRRMKALGDALPRGWMKWRTERRILGHLCTDRAFIDTCLAAVRATGLRARQSLMAGRSDAAVYQREGGIQSVTMGPGAIGTAHTNTEHVPVESLVRGTEAVLTAVRQLATV